MNTNTREIRHRRRRFIFDRLNKIRSRNAQWYPFLKLSFTDFTHLKEDIAVHLLKIN